MLTLNQTAGNNSQSIWALRLRGEGNNLITNGDFASATGWTEGTDWTIGSGVAAYVRTNPNEGGTLSRSITTTSASYVFEYEVISQSGVFVLKLDSNSGIVASDIELDKTIGKHSIQIKCNGGSTLKITVENSGIDDEITLDNIKLRLLDNTVYISTRDISLDNEYSGQIMHNENYLTDIPFESTIEGSGGAGTVTSFSIAISRYISNTNFDGFFNEFYPSTDGGIIVGRIIDVGICWSGATADTDITWLFRGRIIDYGYQQRQLNLVVFQESEISNKEIPFYSVQKDHNNEISYFTNAPLESYGLPIPIIYGNLSADTSDEDEWGQSRVTPVIVVDKNTLESVVASHKVNAPPDYLRLYVDDLQSYMRLDSTVKTNVDNEAYTSVILQPTPTKILGKLWIKLAVATDQSDFLDLSDITEDTDTDEYIELDSGEGIYINSIDTTPSALIGQLGTALSDISIYFVVSSNDANLRQFKIGYYNSTIPTPTGYEVNNNVTGLSPTHKYTRFGNVTTAKKDTNLPWQIEEICSLDYYIINTEASAGDKIRVYFAYLVIDNIKVPYSARYKKVYLKYPYVKLNVKFTR